MIKLLKSLSCLFILSACVSLPREEIVQDEQNIAKLNEITANVEEKTASSQDYIKCVAEVEKLNSIVKKDKINKDDLDFIYEVFPTKYSNITPKIEPINCSAYLDIEYNKYKQDFVDYCDDKYWYDPPLVSIALLPIRLTNVVLSIGTLGIWCATSMCSSQYYDEASEYDINDPDNSSLSAGFNPIAPGDDWNRDICKLMFPSQEEFLKEQNFASFTNVEKLTNQIDDYFKAERTKKAAAIKAEQQKKQKLEEEQRRRQFEECMKDPACREYQQEQQRRIHAQMACSDELTRCSRQCAYDYIGVEYMRQECMDACLIYFNKCKQQ